MKKILLSFFLLIYSFSLESDPEINQQTKNVKADKKENNQEDKKINLRSFFSFRFMEGKKPYFLQYNNKLITNVFFYSGRLKKEKSVLFFKGIKTGKGTILIQNDLVSNFYRVEIIDPKILTSKKKTYNEDFFKNGKKLFKEKNYREALPYLLDFYEKNKESLSEKNENSLFFIGNIYLEYPHFSPAQAKKYFTILIEKYSQGEYFNRAKRKIFYIDYKFY